MTKDEESYVSELERENYSLKSQVASLEYRMERCKAEKSDAENNEKKWRSEYWAMFDEVSRRKVNEDTITI